MSAQTGMDKSEKRRTLHRLDALHASAKDIVQKGTRSPGDVLLLLEALQAFKDGTLGAFVRMPHQELPTEEIISRCGLEIVAAPFSPEDQRYLKVRGLRYVGEIYSLWFDPRSLFSLVVEERIRSVLTGCLGLPTDVDPVALGWEPSYWRDHSFLQELNVLILDRCRTPAEPDWDTCPLLPYGRRLTPHLRSFARRMHVKRIHFMGELLSPEHAQAHNEHCPFGKRTSGFLTDLRRSFKDCGSRLWPGCLLPSGWTPPDWQTNETWMAELIKIKMEDERFEAAKKRREANLRRRLRRRENPS